MRKIRDIESGKVVGIGKLKIFMTEEFQHEIPTLSFVMAKDNSGHFVATCIPLIVEGVGETPDLCHGKYALSHYGLFGNTLFRTGCR